MKKILVCPVAYNENIKLKNAIERFLKSGVLSYADYLVVDDGSNDGTTEMIKSFSPQGVGTLKHTVRRGVGSAIRTAIHYAREKKYDVIVIMAGNDKDDPQEIPGLVDPILKDTSDIVQGSRYLQGGGIGGDMPAYRKIATRFHPLLLSWLTGQKVTDSTNGFRAIRLSVFNDERINVNQAWLDDYELEPYVLFKMIKLKYRFLETPVTKIYPAKKLGYTKMRPFVGWWSILKPLVYLGLGLKK